MAHLYIGSCSWKYNSWRGLVYSPSGDLNYLAEYSRKYNTVEIDQWFWSLFAGGKVVLPNPEVVQEYARVVPADFKFSIKLPNSITLTHYYRKDKSAELKVNPFFLSVDLYQRLLDILAPLHKHIGVLMLQFEYLNKQKMKSQQEFLSKLERFIGQIDRRFIVAIEIRNPNYLNSTYFKFLQLLKLSHVFLQGYYMPGLNEIYDQVAGKLISPTVIRLHGPDRSGIETKSGGNWNRIIEPRDQEISRISEIINDLHTRKLDVYINVNNHYEGSAPLTIEKIRQQIKDIYK
jgi:uncharacterized protein YecE (DUF72 family)